MTRSHFRELVDGILPFLAGAQVGTCLFRDYWSGNTVVNGGYGVELQGKAMSNLPNNDRQTGSVAKGLVSLTGQMSGPDVPGAYHLGGRVYAEYAGSDGSSTYRPDAGRRGLLRFFQQLGFVLPAGVTWPFS